MPIGRARMLLGKIRRRSRTGITAATLSRLRRGLWNIAYHRNFFADICAAARGVF